MKTAAILLVVLMSLYMVSGIAAAKAGIEVLKGTIVSIDTAKNEIVIKELATKMDKAITADPKIISTLKVGETVKVELKSGSAIAESVKVITVKKK